MDRLGRERRTIAVMIEMYCRDHHREVAAPLCPECRHLLAYSERRLARCRFGEQKRACGRCAVHCFAPVMRERTQAVMRYSGPRMTTRHPVLALAHLMDRRRAQSFQDRVLSSGLLPDPVLRRVVRSRVKGLAESFERLSPPQKAERERALLARFETGPITINADDANRQHYDLPPEFFRLVLGPRLKYSSCFWTPGVIDLAQAEEAMLALTAERADLADGQDILDLGCGWGSLALWAAERFPQSRVMAMSNSREQRAFIESTREERGLANIEVVTASVANFDPQRRFDRVVSVEMFEHARNHRELLRRVAGWLQPEGKLFVHVFCHRDHLYAFEPDGPGGWMARRFFSGGIMPSWDYLARCQEHLELVDRWQVDGSHYARTLRAWLDNLDHNREAVLPILEGVYGRERARLWLAHWRLFFMVCEETFALGSGREYFVAHYLFKPPGRAAPSAPRTPL